MNEDDSHDYNERAGICEYDGKVSRREAEEIARKQLCLLTKGEYEALALLRAADQLTIEKLTPTQKATYSRIVKKGAAMKSDCGKYLLYKEQKPLD